MLTLNQNTRRDLEAVAPIQLHPNQPARHPLQRANGSTCHTRREPLAPVTSPGGAGVRACGRLRL